MADDPKTIADGLSADERFCLLDHRPYRGSPKTGWLEDPRDPRSWSRAGRVLRDKGLIEWANSRDSNTRLTARGTAVRRYLQGEAP